ncbi:hypothetical protein ACE939_11545 [Aquimarina sp. W85]|uniref:hypothetical protein n=1 Tax=Aquimarina rhodophyticola TaxID=3342246 RepID=UPI003672C6D9
MKLPHLIGYPVVIVITAILVFFISQSKCNKPKLYEPDGPPQELISFNEIIDLYDNYHGIDSLIQKYTRQKSSDPSFVASKAVTFDYQELKNYLAFIEKNSVKANIKISSLRFYFGKYQNMKDKTKANRQTLFYNPTTIFNVNGKDVELSYAIESNSKGTRVIPLSKILDSVKKVKGIDITTKQTTSEASLLPLSSIISATANVVESQAGNRGQVTPPPSDLQ